MSVSLEEITRDNLRQVLNLKVSAEQERFVASNAVSLAQAHFEEALPWYRVVCADGEPVGFVMVEFNHEDGFWYLWRFMIDAKHQGKGYGRLAMALVFDHVRAQPKGNELWTSCVPEPGGPGPFYEKLGFAYTGDEEDGELYMRVSLA